MKNIHIYPSDFSNESRILRTVDTISALEIFDSIEMVGILGEEKVSYISENVSIRRFKRNIHIKNRILNKIGKLIGHLMWLIKVLNFYRSQNIACINAHSLTVLPLCVILKMMTGAKLVYDTHELESQTNGAGKYRRVISKFIESKLISFADVNIFVSTSIKDWYLREFNVSNSHVVLNCPIPKNVTKGNVFRDKFNIPSEKKIFLYQGVLSAGRGIELILEAFSQLGDTDNVVVIMGYGPLECLVKDEANKHDNIYFHDSVSPTVLLSYTASADVGLSIIFPTSLSYEYCMPNKLFEYINAGIPSIVSPTVEQKNFVQKQAVGIAISGYNASNLVEAVISMNDLASYDLAINKAKITYTWLTESEKIKTIYTELFSGNNNEI